MDYNKEQIFFGKNYRILSEQTIGPRWLEAVKEKYSVKELRSNSEIIFLIENKDEIRESGKGV